MSESEHSGRSMPSGAEVLGFPARTLRSAAGRIPGAGAVRGVYDGAAAAVGAVSPRTRRIGAYAGAGLAAAVGVVEWPVAAVGAAAVWLTQSRPHTPGDPQDRSDPRRPRDQATRASSSPSATTTALRGPARQTTLARNRKARHKARQRAQQTAS